MQKKVLIIIGSIIITILLLVWVYLLVFGTPKNVSEVFTDFSKNSGEIETVEEAKDTPENQTTVDTTGSKLKQLTTKPIAGFNEITSTTTNSKFVYYAEMGTGHIYAINLNTGEEKRLSGTTVTGVNTAAISAKGDYVVLGNRGNDKSIMVTVGKISTSTNEIITKELSTTVDDLTITINGNDLLYTTKDVSSLSGHAYNFKTGTDKTIFTVPFHEAIIQWGKKAEDTHYLYPKPTYLLEGYLYQIKNGKMSRLPVSGHGLTALANEEIVAYTVSKNGERKNYVFDRKTKTTSPLAPSILPEKCIIAVSGYKLICAWEGGVESPIESPDKWYQGVTKYKDSLWNIYGDDSTINLITDTLKDSGREIDIINLMIGNEDRAMYFINKNDNTLWMYEI